MEIIFKKEKTLCFSEVKTNQFFINTLGQLCQKIDSQSYNIIANDDGKPHGVDSINTYDAWIIKKILPEVEKIIF